MRAIELYEYHETEDITYSREIIDKIRTECEIALKSTPIYRGFKDVNDNILYGVPKNPRKSANTNNFYTIIIDSLPSWRHFPQRSLSWICTGDKHVAAAFGNVFRVLPIGNPNIAIAPKGDLWISFKRGLDALVGTNGDFDLSDFNHWIEVMFNIAYKKGLSDENTPDTLNDIEIIMDTIAGEAELNPSFTDDDRSNRMLINIQNSGGFLNFMNDVVFNPENNGIGMSKLNSLRLEGSGDNELWFNGAAYFVPYDVEILLSRGSK